MISTFPPRHNCEENIDMPSPTLMTIGTSNNSWEEFRRLLELAGAEAIVDVRSRPYSRHRHFCQSELKARLEHVGLPYMFMGHQLGGLNEGAGHTYAEVARSPTFLEGIARVREVGLRCKPALMCAEAEPLRCHRFLLVARALAASGTGVAHILRDGTIEPQWETELRLLRITRLGGDDFWTTAERRLSEAYLRQEQRVIGAGRRK